MTPLQPSADHPSRGVVDDWTAADNGDYDRSIHANPSAEAWADFFVATFPKQAHLRDLMRGWFANAMMAMHDHLHYKAQAAALPAVPEVPESLRDALEDALRWSPKSFAGSDAIRRFQVLAGDYVERLIEESATPAHDQPEGSDND